MTRGERVCKFIETYCAVPDGKLVGKPMRLMAAAGGRVAGPRAGGFRSHGRAGAGWRSGSACGLRGRGVELPIRGRGRQRPGSTKAMAPLAKTLRVDIEALLPPEN